MSLVFFCVYQGKFREAEELYKRSLAIDEKVYGPDHPEIATGLNSWALLLKEEVSAVRNLPGIFVGGRGCRWMVFIRRLAPDNMPLFVGVQRKQMFKWAATGQEVGVVGSQTTLVFDMPSKPVLRDVAVVGADPFAISGFF